MKHAYLCEGLRTPIGGYGKSLSGIRADDLLAHSIRATLNSTPNLDYEKIDDGYFGCANQAGEDNRNVGRMATLLAGVPDSVPAATINRLCGSGLDAIGIAARAVMSGEADVVLAGGVESMSRAPFVMPKSETAFSRNNAVYDTTIGWRFVNSLMKDQYGIDSMPETAENVAEEFGISRKDQDAFALRSQERAIAARASGRFAKEICPLTIPQRRGDAVLVEHDEHPRETSLQKLGNLKTPFRDGGTVTAGNASGVNDGAAAVIIASDAAIKDFNLTPKARVLGMATAGVPPRIMGIGPAPASEKLLNRLRIDISRIDIIELNEAFAAQALATIRKLGLPEDAEHINPNGGAIALGHPLGMSGTRLALTASIELAERQVKTALCTMCIGVGQGIALALERV